MSLDSQLINIHKVYQSEQFIRLSDIIGFTGLGPDLSRKYIKDIIII